MTNNTLTRFALLAVAVGALASCSSSQRPSRPVAPPAYKVATTENISYGAVRRLSVRASLPEHYTRDDVELVAQDIVADITSSQDVNAISIFFYGPQTPPSGVCDLAMVEWAPNGIWGDAETVRAGDYSTFRYNVAYNPPAPAPDETTATREDELNAAARDYSLNLDVQNPSGRRIDVMTCPRNINQGELEELG